MSNITLENTKVKKGYKQTELGIIPEDWDVKKLGETLKVKHGKDQKEVKNENGIYPILGTGGLMGFTNHYLYDSESVLIGRKGTIDKPQYMNSPFWTVDTLFYTEISKSYSPKFIYYKFLMIDWYSYNEASGVPSLNARTIEKIEVILPPLPEQTAIAAALSDADALITSIEQLIAKKRAIKQGAMQELFRPKKGWEVKKLGEIGDILDNLRKPLNDNERQQMKGDIPYCGANGIVDYVDDYVIDDEIILMAEDGGYFDEYKTRPIAYKMSGKCWVNNHAHILKAKNNVDQDFLFYSLVHKNILDFINGGTRAKLNKSELVNIIIFLPLKEEQTPIAAILSDMDAEIEQLERKLDKYRQIKQGMMQELLTGRIRLV